MKMFGISLLCLPVAIFIITRRGAPGIIYHPDTFALASKNNPDEQSEGVCAERRQLEQTLSSGMLAFSYLGEDRTSLLLLEHSG